METRLGSDPPPNVSINTTKEFLNILLVSRRKELLEELKKKLDRSDRHIEVCVQDITENEAEKKIFKKWEDFSFKSSTKIDHLICNAGILIKSSPKDINLYKNKLVWDKLYKTNYISQRKIINYALDNNLLNQCSHIAITNSIEGKRYMPTPNNYFGAYGKSKKMMEKWVTHDLRKNKKIMKNNIKITVMYPSKIDGPMFFNILEKDGKRTKRKPEWEIIGFKKEPYKEFNNHALDVLALRYYLAIQTNKPDEYSSLEDRIMIKYFPEPFSFFLFYLVGLTKNLSLIDIPIYLILQFPYEIIVLFRMAVNNFYIKENRITKKDIKQKEYELDNPEIRDDENIIYRYYIMNTSILLGLGYYTYKKIKKKKRFN